MSPLARGARRSCRRRHLAVLLGCLYGAPREAEAQSAAVPPPDAPKDVKHVTYVPEAVKDEIRNQIKQDVLEQAKREGWASPETAAPEWTRRFTFHGDIRGRFERDLFGKGNANQGEFPDFTGINNTTGFDVNGVDLTNDRYLNVDADRTRPRLRARLGVDVTLWGGFSVGLRLGSGDGSTPVSTNQTLGGAPGDFSKYQVWLDRAFIRYAPIDDPETLLSFYLGRFENPFFTYDFLWSDQVNFDGVATRIRFPLSGAFNTIFNAGAFPVFTSTFSFPPELPSKGDQFDAQGNVVQRFRSLNKWLYAAQLGGDWRPREAFGLKLAAAFYYFHDIEGRVSPSCDTNVKGFSCDTDESRPLFAQKGNTYLGLRNPSDAALLAEATNPGRTPRYQYYGLASHFRELVLTARIDLRIAPAVAVGFEGEVVRNFGFKPTEISAVAVNNLGKCPEDPTQRCPYAGGRDGYRVGVSFGSPTQAHPWDWSVGADYRYLQTDAVVDAFTDPDFGLGGTNLRGYVLAGSLYVAEGVWFRVRWLSANAIVGPTYRADVLQVDLNARF